MAESFKSHSGQSNCIASNVAGGQKGLAAGNEPASAPAAHTSTNDGRGRTDCCCRCGCMWREPPPPFAVRRTATATTKEHKKVRDGVGGGGNPFLARQTERERKGRRVAQLNVVGIERGKPNATGMMASNEKSFPIKRDFHSGHAFPRRQI